MGCMCRGEILPVLLLVCLPIFLLTTYGVAVSLGHVKASFPYISDTGTHPPESCIFGFLQGIYAVMSAICIFFRYAHVGIYYKNSGRRVLRNTNIAAFVIGLISVLGIYLVANFQETNVLAVHLIGALLAFAGGNVYFWIQSIMSYRIRDVPGHRWWLPHFRMTVTVLHLISLIVVLIGAAMANNDTHDDTKTTPSSFLTSSRAIDIPHWKPSDPGFPVHIASTSMEWILVLLSGIFFCTFAFEFSHFRVTWPQVRYSATMDINNIINAKATNGVINPVSTIYEP